MWNLKNNQNKINEQAKPNQNKHIDTENRIVVPRRERVGVCFLEIQILALITLTPDLASYQIPDTSKRSRESIWLVETGAF